MAVEPKKPRNLLRLAGVINAANSEADNEAGELIERIRRNQSRTLGLIAKGHHNESMREQMLTEAEKEQALADLEAAVGDNGGPLLEEPDEDQDKVRAELKAAKSEHGSKSSQDEQEKQNGATASAIANSSPNASATSVIDSGGVAGVSVRNFHDV